MGLSCTACSGEEYCIIASYAENVTQSVSAELSESEKLVQPSLSCAYDRNVTAGP